MTPARAAGIAALLALAGCAPYALTPSPAGPASPPPAVAPAPAVPTPPTPPLRTPIPRPDVSVADQCGAKTMQRLVGRPRSEVPVPLEPSRQRVACTTCPVTLDYNPARLNFFFDAESGIIREVRCG